MVESDFADSRSLLGLIYDRQGAERTVHVTAGPDDEKVTKSRGEDPFTVDGPPISRPRMTASRGED